jgi:hypothetical protein
LETAVLLRSQIPPRRNACGCDLKPHRTNWLTQSDDKTGRQFLKEIDLWPRRAPAGNLAEKFEAEPFMA